MRIGLLLASLTLLAACATESTVPPPSGSKPPAAHRFPPDLPPSRPTVPQSGAGTAAPEPRIVHSRGEVVVRNERFVIYLPVPEDTLYSLAEDFLGDGRRHVEIAEFNRIERVDPAQAVVIPLRRAHPQGISREGYQTVTVLCYHRFGAQTSRMVVSPTAFAEQLQYLAVHGYSVVRLADLIDFLDGRRALPERAVIITIDDGYVSTYHHAYPLLKKHAFPATVFVYTDFLGARDALTWAQMKEMTASGLIDLQAHSKSHSNLTQRLPAESEEHYLQRVEREVTTPREMLRVKLDARVQSYAYPYGDTNDAVISRLDRAGYKLGLTVNAGGNAFFSDPMMLRRTMVYGSDSLETFQARLQTHRQLDLR